ncbi:inositol transport system permease protein [Klebsiella pneumoniae]|uniref:Inositol transport system permease protein n=1 Tax=Klebsiella pneumoniae TaxID=573 RepID=A0A447S233_KLEPN|nr:inositol transport system permease protein [Klebsiella pneumoniae]
MFATSRSCSNTNRLVLIVLQGGDYRASSAVGVTQVIITTGIDLSSGSVIALAAVVAASLGANLR